MNQRFESDVGISPNEHVARLGVRPLDEKAIDSILLAVTSVFVYFTTIDQTWIMVVRIKDNVDRIPISFFLTFLQCSERKINIKGVAERKQKLSAFASEFFCFVLLSICYCSHKKRVVLFYDHSHKKKSFFYDHSHKRKSFFMTSLFIRSPRGERNMTLIENIALQRYVTTNEKNGTKTKTYKFLVRDIHKTPFEKKYFFFKITRLKLNLYHPLSRYFIYKAVYFR